jgi:hypothetical protein
MKCPTCHQHALERFEGRRAVEVAGRHYSSAVAALRCPGCRAILFKAGALSAFERAVAAHLACHGPVDGESFQFLRKAARLTATDLAVHLGVTAVDRAAWLVVGSLVLDETPHRDDLRRRLDTLAKPSRAKRVRLGREALKTG